MCAGTYKAFSASWKTHSDATDVTPKTWLHAAGDRPICNAQKDIKPKNGQRAPGKLFLKVSRKSPVRPDTVPGKDPATLT